MNEDYNIWGEPTKKAGRDSRRTFTRTQKNEIWAQQNGKCAKCKNQLDPRATEYDHKKGWADKGQTVTVNGQALCANCHKKKTHKDRLKKIENKGKKKESGGIFGRSIFDSPKRRGKRPKSIFDI